MESIKQIAFEEDNYGLLLGLVLLTIPLPYAYSSIALIVLLALSLIHAMYKPKALRTGYLIPVALFALMLLSILWSVDVPKSLRGLERQLPFLLIPMAFWMMPEITKRQFSRVLSLFSYGLALFGIWMMLRSVYRGMIGQGNWVFSYHYLVDIFDLNAIYISVMTALSVLFMLFYKKKTLWNVFTIIALALFLVLLSSKNNIAITTICVVIGLFISNVKSVKKWWGLLLLIFGLAAIVFYGPLNKRWNVETESNITEAWTAEVFSDVYPWTGTSLRVFQARVFYELFQEDGVWFMGYGINAVQEKISDKQNDYHLYCGYNTYNFHNQYIQTFAELGVFGFILLLGLFYILIRLYLMHKEPFVLFMILVMGFVLLTETYIWRQRGMFHFLILFGMLVSWLPLHKNKKDKV